MGARADEFRCRPGGVVRTVIEQIAREWRLDPRHEHRRNWGITGQGFHPGASREADLRELLDGHPGTSPDVPSMAAQHPDRRATRAGPAPTTCSPGYWSDARPMAQPPVWSQRAAGRQSTEADRFDHIPRADGLAARPAGHAHICANRTIHGVGLFQELPELPAGVPLVADMSSVSCRARWMSRAFSLIYAGAQKEHRPGRPRHRHRPRDLLGRRCPPAERDGLCHDGGARLHAHQHPPTFGIYLAGLVFQEPQGPGRAGGASRSQHRQIQIALQRHRRQRRLLCKPVGGQPLAL